jgi:F-type H+-transporting ATPase subunit a
MPNPLEHVVDKPLLAPGPWNHEWMISNATVMLIAGSLVCLIMLIYAANRIATGKTNTIDDFRAQGFTANLVETVCVYLRNDVFRPVLAEKTDIYTPYLWTIFWLILVCNLMGLLPFADVTSMLNWGHEGHGIGGTATQSIWVTSGLALLTFVISNIAGLRADFVGYFKHLTGGAPWPMWPIIIPIEILGIFIKPFSLAMRLFANMTGGHIVIAVLLSFVYMLVHNMGPFIGYPVSIIPILGSLFVYLLEVLVCFIQAFVFTFLTCLFIGQLVIHKGHGDHGHDHEGHGHAGHDHGHAH